MSALSIWEYLKNIFRRIARRRSYAYALSNGSKYADYCRWRGEATVEIDTDSKKHGNQQGTVHGGLIFELADAAIGTAYSTLMTESDSCDC